MVIQCGMTARALAAKRGAVRIFRTFETLVGYLKSIGIAKYQVDASQFDPVALKTERKRITKHIAKDSPRAAIELGELKNNHARTECA